MRYRALSPTGDYTWGGSLANFYVDVPAAPGQAVVTRLRLAQGEWYLDSQPGTPYFTGVIGKFPQTTADSTIQNRIINTQGVIAIAKFQSIFNPTDRNYSVQASVDTQYGTTQVSTQTLSSAKRMIRGVRREKK